MRDATRLVLSGLALALVFLGGGGGGDAQAARKAIWGPVELPGGGSAFPLYRRLGVDTLQLSLNWADVAPTQPRDAADPGDPAYRWPAEVETAVAGARAVGIELALVVASTPPWANGGRSREWAPERPRDYARFLTAASRRYPSVRRWLIWNEPNKATAFRPNRAGDPIAPRTYAPLLDAAYRALKRESRRNIVVGGMTWSGGEVKPRQFLRWLRLPSGKPPRLDLYGHNPFPFRFPNLRERTIAGGWRDISDLDVFAREVRRAYRSRGRRPKLWLGEFTVQSDRESRDFKLFVSRAAQARWLRAGYRIADRLPSVAGLAWLGLLDEPEAPRSTRFGLLTAGGARKPAYKAFARAPSRRLRPRVRTAWRPGRTLVVRVRPRARGRVRVQLRRGGRVLRRRSRSGRRGRVLRVRFSDAGGSRRFRVVVTAARGERVVIRVRPPAGVP